MPLEAREVSTVRIKVNATKNGKTLVAVRIDFIVSNVRVFSKHSNNSGNVTYDNPVIGLYTIEGYGRGLERSDWITGLIVESESAFDTIPPDLSSGSGDMESA